MHKRNKLKELSISMLIGVVCLLIFAALSYNAASAYLFGHHTYGEIVEYNVARERPSHYTASDRTPERHEIVVEYSVDSQPYWILVNSHAYSAMGILDTGDKMLVSYTKEYPEHGYLMSYALFSVSASLMAPFILLIFLVVTPQWFYQLRKSDK
jgi:hypothetical protein